MTPQEQNFINLGRVYLNFLYQKKEYEISGKNAPDDLMDAIVTLERQIRNFLDAIEQVSLKTETPEQNPT